MAESTHRVEVVPVEVEPIPGSDHVGLVRVFGYTVVTRLDGWAPGQLGAFVPPDSLVDTRRPEFAFLSPGAGPGIVRIKAKRLRNTLSFGLLVPAPTGSVPGDDVAERLGVTHYEPPVKGEVSRSPTAPAYPGPSGVVAPKYDVEAGRRYWRDVFAIGEPVVVTEKVHGANGRVVYAEGKLHVGSRTQWKPESADCPWWRAVADDLRLGAFCRANPGWVIYGEVYGAVQDLSYNVPKGKTRFVVFDLLRPDGGWVDWETLITYPIPLVPFLPTAIPFDPDVIARLAEQPSLLADGKHIGEGVVVRKPVGRSLLKWVGASYLERSKG